MVCTPFFYLVTYEELKRPVAEISRLWRFTGSLTAVLEFYLRVQHWHEEFEFLATPFMIWGCCIFLASDLVYGVCSWYIEQYEQVGGMTQLQKHQ